jgi:hypothetical protein
MGGMGGMGGEGGEGGFGMGGMGGRGTAGGNKPKLVDIQDWKTRIARRRLNEVSQAVHRAIDGKRVSADSGNALAKMHMSKPEVAFEEDYKLSKLVTALEDLQKAVNDPTRVRTVTNLMNLCKKPIEEIMDFAKKMPGFLEKYPELKDDEELLEEATEPKPDDGKKDGDQPADAGAGGDKPVGGEKPADGEPGEGAGTGSKGAGEGANP